MKNRKSSFYYVVEIENWGRQIVRHSSPQKALKLALGNYTIKRASIEDVAGYLGEDLKIKEGANG